MPLPEKTCVSCGKRFTLLPSKPGLARTCPQCSTPPVRTEVVDRSPTTRRQKTTNELVADAERKLRRHKKLIEMTYGRTKEPGKARYAIVSLGNTLKHPSCRILLLPA
jgi:DNA-directed RNA polymerase subunit RPC12/RpoP